MLGVTFEVAASAFLARVPAACQASRDPGCSLGWSLSWPRCCVHGSGWRRLGWGLRQGLLHFERPRQSRVALLGFAHSAESMPLPEIALGAHVMLLLTGDAEAAEEPIRTSRARI